LAVRYCWASSSYSKFKNSELNENEYGIFTYFKNVFLKKSFFIAGEEIIVCDCFINIEKYTFREAYFKLFKVIPGEQICSVIIFSA
jgi:hypothetical protein